MSDTDKICMQLFLDIQVYIILMTVLRVHLVCKNKKGNGMRKKGES